MASVVATLHPVNKAVHKAAQNAISGIKTKAQIREVRESRSKKIMQAAFFNIDYGVEFAAEKMKT